MMTINPLESAVDRDHFMSASEAKEFGLIDQVLNNWHCDYCCDLLLHIFQYFHLLDCKINWNEKIAQHTSYESIH